MVINKISLVSIVLLVAMLVAGCGRIAQAKTGDTVRVHYTGKLQNGTVFDSSVGGDPLEFTLGQGQVIPGFEQAVTGMQVGENRTVTIPVDQAYGPHRDDLVLEVGRDKLPPDLTPEIGMQLQMNRTDGGITVVTVTDISETTITIDANPPLAGKDLIFDLELVSIGASGTQDSSLTSMPLSQALTNGLPTIAELGSKTCVPCKQMKPILEKLAVEYKGKLNIVIIDIYEQKALAEQYSILAIPTQIVFDSSGKEVTRHMGLWPRENIVAQLNKMGIK